LLNLQQPWLRRGDLRLRGFAREAPYSVNLLVVNADQLPQVYRQSGLRRGGGYDIGFWAWELPQFPRATHAAALDLVDEIWTFSEFCRSAFAAAASVPVVKIVPALSVDAPGRRTRADFGFDDAFTFLYVYDSASIVKRKNPGAAISAFRRAFDPDEPVRLVLKTMNATPRQVAALERLAGDARVSVRNGYLGRGELLDLLVACDAYVSLHRSEGLGLGLLEMLMLNKPVVATNYSGVTEFLKGPGTYPVGFREVRLRRAYGPYPKGSAWADPDVAEAARRLRELYEDWRPGGCGRREEHGPTRALQSSHPGPGAGRAARRHPRDARPAPLRRRITPRNWW
jgi:glycosyltransferase involved in cell wall biosynthesis